MVAAPASAARDAALCLTLPLWGKLRRQYATLKIGLSSGRVAVIVDARGGDVGMAKPFLHFRNVGRMIERVGGGGRAQRAGALLLANSADDCERLSGSIPK